jgi:hypothetical protein
MITNKTETDLPLRRHRFGRPSIWLAGSALFGSLALVLWNRQTLKKLRESTPAEEEQGQFSDDDAIY